MGVAIVIIVVLIAAAATLLVTTRRRASVGGLSRETLKSDAGSPDAPAAAASSSSTELELQGRERADDTRARTGRDVAERPAGTVPRWEPVDEEELGVTRRQFMNRGILAAVGFG